MAKTTKPSAARLKEILKRQDPCGWGETYVPTIKATREEAPGRSRPSQIWWERHQRFVHALSDVEKHFALLAMFYPWIFELQEQRMLHYLPAPHPLDSHPKGAGVIRRSLRGTLEVSDSLKMLHHHSRVPIPRAGTGHAVGMMPFPWAGDLLLYLEDSCGPYCVNWTIKANIEDFDRPGRKFRTTKAFLLAVEKEQARHRIEVLYYLDADIPTVRLVAADIDIDLVANLAQLLPYTKRKHSFSTGKVREIVNCFKGAIGTLDSAMSIVFDLARANGCDTQPIKIVLHQAIWQRELRIDLFKPFAIDKPLRREVKDPIDVYARWFARG